MFTEWENEDKIICKATTSMYILLNNLKYSSVKQMLLHITKYIPVLYCIIKTAGRFLDVNLGGMKLEVRCILQKLQNKI